METVLEVRGLTKRFGDVAAVDGLDLDLGRGEVVGLLGPNGAGKTTTLRLLLGLARPTSGEVSLLGHAPGHGDALARVGAVVEEPAFYPYLSGRDNLRVLARYAGATEDRIEDALSEVDLVAAAGNKVKTYSLGMRQRLALASAMLKDPEVLMLDEPANGLDPAGISALRRWVRDFASRERAVLFSSHLLSEVEQICDRVVVLLHGRVVADGRVDELRPEKAVVVRADPVDLATAVASELDAVSSATVVDGRLRVVVRPGAIADLNAALVGAGVRVSELSPAHRSLEEIFFELTRSVDAPARGERR